jgi:hypothetical protein
MMFPILIPVSVAPGSYFFGQRLVRRMKPREAKLRRTRSVGTELRAFPLLPDLISLFVEFENPSGFQSRTLHRHPRYHFELMGRQIQLRNGRLVSENGTLAGAHLELASAVKNAVTLVGISLDDALRAASLVPARFLGIEHHRGTPSAGARADISH